MRMFTAVYDSQPRQPLILPTWGVSFLVTQEATVWVSIHEPA